MKRNGLILVICLFLVSGLSAADKYDALTSSPNPAARISGTRFTPTIPKEVGEAQYRPSTRQNEVLFVEDWMGTFGTATHPDPNWDAELANIFGAGGYGWYATTAAGQNGPDLVTMQGYQLVIWNCYDDWWTGSGLTATDMTNIAAYLAGGGKVWLIGQDIIYGGAGSFVQTNFNVSSYVEDYNYDSLNANIQGLAEIAGINLNLTSDYPANNFFCDDLTPNANAHHVVLDLDHSTYPAIFNNDYTRSFWTIDGRTPNPAANWSQIINQMLGAFGVLGPAAFWDFEDGLQGWTHTNGQAFPAGWDVEESGLHTSYTPPDAGDSTMWIDSDAAGYVTIWDTAYSPAVVPPADMTWLKYGLGFLRYSGGNAEWVSVGVRTFTSGAWQPPVELTQHTTSFSPAWESLNVSAYQSVDSIMVFFSYNDAYYEFYAAFDNVGLYAPPGEDVGVTAILEPVGVYSLNDVVTPQAEVRNFGDLEETFPVIFTMTRNAVLVYADTVDITLAAGVADTAIFDSYTFTDAGAYDIVSYTELVGDENPANDTAYATALIFEWVEDFESSNGGFVAEPVSGAWEWGVPTSGPGAAHSGTQLWATVLAGPYSNDANWTLTTQDDYVASQDNPIILFYHWYDIETRWDGGNVKYSTDGINYLLLHPTGGYDDTAYTANSGIPAESCFTGHPAVWEAEEFIIPVTSGQTFRLRFHFGSDGSVTYPGWYIDDLAGIGFDYVGIEEEPGAGQVAVFGFAPNMSTLNKDRVSIFYTTTAPSHVSLKVYDNTGRLVRTLVDTQQPAGEKSVLWDNRDVNKRMVANGVYFLKLEAEGKTAVRKLILVN
jgi:hypothetical protein